MIFLKIQQHPRSHWIYWIWKIEIEWAFLISTGILFQSKVPEYWKLFKNNSLFGLGILYYFVDIDIRWGVLPGSLYWNRDCKYSGALLLDILYINLAFLKQIRSLIGNIFNLPAKLSLHSFWFDISLNVLFWRFSNFDMFLSSELPHT